MTADRHDNADDDLLSATLVNSARDGERHALETLVRAVSGDVYRLALRMTGSVEDAEDATQEILIKVITRLSTFRADASLRTWVYRIAVNHLLDRRKGRVEALDLNWESFATDLLDGLADSAAAHDAALVEEVKLGCTLAMLTCLDREDRVAYLLSEVFDLPHETAAQMLHASSAGYRQRLSRARRRIEGFTEAYCGLVNPQAPCRCDRRVSRAIELGRLTRDRLVLTTHPKTATEKHVRDMERLYSTAALMRAHPEYAAPEAVIRAILDTALVAARDDDADLTIG